VTVVRPDRLGWVAGVLLLSLSADCVAELALRFKLVPRASVEARLGQYQGGNRERQATLKAMFTDVGCGEHMSEQRVRPHLPNLICVLPGASDRVIIIGAHYDRVSQSDGVADNWSGASLLPSLYEAIKIEPRQHTYIFVAFSAEEEGLVGSHVYAHEMTRAQVSATDAMVNLDTLGLDSTNVWVSHSNEKLVLELAYVAKLIGSPINGLNFEEVGYSTDSESFARRRIPSIAVHSLNQKVEDAGILHSRRDVLSAIHLDNYYETYRLMTVYLVYLDHGLDGPAKTPDH
jgi:putative aminopeptidase FrvX